MIFKRYASSKVAVQLLKDFPGLGFRGEVVQVRPGRMRNQLHMNNGAAYVLKGKPLRIPVVSREEIEAKQARLAAAAEKERQEQLAKDTAEMERRRLQDRDNRVRVMTDLLFAKPEGEGETTTAAGPDASTGSTASAPVSDSSSSSFALSEALASLPKVLRINWPAKDAKLSDPINPETIAQHLSVLTGYPIGASSVLIPEPVTELGSSRVTVSTGSTTNSFTLTVVNGTKPQHLKVIKTKPTQAPALAPQAQAAQSKEPAPIQSKEPKDSGSFEWENDAIRQMERRMKR